MLFDVQPLPSSDLTALSRLAFEQEYLPNAVAADTLAANDRSYEQRLSACRMIAAIDSPVPTILGMLVGGITPRDWLPGHFAQFLQLAAYRRSVVDGLLSMVRWRRLSGD